MAEWPLYSGSRSCIYIARITTVEVIAALTRRTRGGTISATDASTACLLFKDDVTHDYEVIEMTATLLNRAVTLAETHGLRGYDAMQLAAACEVNAMSIVHGLAALTVVSADSELNAVATREGLLVDDPNAHP